MKKQIGEHTVDIPDWQQGMELLNEGLPDVDSYWRRIEFPKLFYDIKDYTKMFSHGTEYDSDGKLLSVSEEDSRIVKDLIVKDIYRRKFGVHIKIKNKIKWIAPDYYFFLQWFNQKHIAIDANGNSYGSYRDIQNTILQLWEYVKKNPEIAGLIVPKIKKSGMTYLFAGALLNEFTSTRNIDILAMSKDPDTALASVFAFVKYGYDEMPYALRGKLSKTNESELFLGKPKEVKNQYSTTGRYLRSTFTVTKTKVAAFDGYVPFRCWVDEFPKLWKASKVSVKETMDKSIEAVKKNQQITGKILFTSYMPEEFDKGFEEARDYCNRSLLRTIKDGSLRTDSSLIIFPIYAYQSNQECFDIYGDCDEQEAAKKTLAERATKTSPRDIQSHKRQYPMSWGEMFDNTGAGSTFNGIRLAPRDTFLREEDLKGVRFYKEGHLRWENSDWEHRARPIGKFCPVYFQELTPSEIAEGKKGSFKIFFDLEKDFPDLRYMLNRPFRESIKRNELYVPHHDNLGVSSVDPVDYKIASQVREGSLNASYGGFVFDPIIDSIAKDFITDAPLYEYNFRHENPDKILEDMIKAMMYWGFYCLVENNKGWINTELQKHELQNFLLVRQSDGSITPWEDFAEFDGGNRMVSSDEKMINSYCAAISRYLSAPPDGEVDRLNQLKSYDLTGQLLDFDPMNTRRYDLGVSFGFWRIAIESYSVWRLYKQSSKEKEGEYTEADLDFILR